MNLPFIDNIWGADLTDRQLISQFDKGIRFLLCVIDVFSKYAWVIHLKDKRGITIINFFESNHKPKKIWIDKGSELCNRSMKPWLEKSKIKMNSTHNKEKSVVVVERFIRTLRSKIYK